MKASASITAAARKPFPEEKIRDRIRQFWNEKTDDEEDNPFSPERKNTLYEVVPNIDSLEIVKFMLRIEEVIDIEIPSKVIKRGGYESSDEMNQHLMPQLKELWLNGKV